MNQKPIDEDDLDFIDTILEKYETDTSIVSVSELDGFLTAIISGPDMIMPSEWMPAIWGSEEDAPEWESEEEVSRFIQITMGMMNSNADTLIEQPDDFEAMFLMDIHEGKPVQVVSLWCYGYMRAVGMRAQSWMNLPEDIQQHLGRIAMFGSETGEEALMQLPEETVDNLQEKIEPAARAIHAYWLQQRAHLAPASRRGSSRSMPAAMPMGQVLPFVRQQPKIGPNAPCPCGSGKKYKKCCGAH